MPWRAGQPVPVMISRSCVCTMNETAACTEEQGVLLEVTWPNTGWGSPTGQTAPPAVALPAELG